jgi:hypothetical protein
MPIVCYIVDGEESDAESVIFESNNIETTSFKRSPSDNDDKTLIFEQPKSKTTKKRSSDDKDDVPIHSLQRYKSSERGMLEESNNITKITHCGKVVYEGEALNNKPHGEGTLYNTDGSCYKGSFKNGRKNGHGSLRKNGKLIYFGYWKDDKYHGEGTVYYSDTSSYFGNFKGGLRNGYGRETTHDNIIYAGFWKKGDQQKGG